MSNRTSCIKKYVSSHKMGGFNENKNFLLGKPFLDFSEWMGKPDIRALISNFIIKDGTRARVDLPAFILTESFDRRFQKSFGYVDATGAVVTVTGKMNIITRARVKLDGLNVLVIAINNLRYLIVNGSVYSTTIPIGRYEFFEGILYDLDRDVEFTDKWIDGKFLPIKGRKWYYFDSIINESNHEGFIVEVRGIQYKFRNIWSLDMDYQTLKDNGLSFGVFSGIKEFMCPQFEELRDRTDKYYSDNPIYLINALGAIDYDIPVASKSYIEAPVFDFPRGKMSDFSSMKWGDGCVFVDVMASAGLDNILEVYDYFELLGLCAVGENIYYYGEEQRMFFRYSIIPFVEEKNKLEARKKIKKVLPDLRPVVVTTRDVILLGYEFLASSPDECSRIMDSIGMFGVVSEKMDPIWHFRVSTYTDKVTLFSVPVSYLDHYLYSYVSNRSVGRFFLGSETKVKIKQISTQRYSSAIHVVRPMSYIRPPDRENQLLTLLDLVDRSNKGYKPFTLYDLLCKLVDLINCRKSFHEIECALRKNKIFYSVEALQFVLSQPIFEVDYDDSIEKWSVPTKDPFKEVDISCVEPYHGWSYFNKR